MHTHAQIHAASTLTNALAGNDPAFSESSLRWPSYAFLQEMSIGLQYSISWGYDHKTATDKTPHFLHLEFLFHDNFVIEVKDSCRKPRPLLERKLAALTNRCSQVEVY